MSSFLTEGHMYLCFASTSFSQGNIVHCGLRNGAIVSVDLRERPGRPFPRLTRHQIRYQSSSKTGLTSTKKQWFEVLLRSCNDFVLVTTFCSGHNFSFFSLELSSQVTTFYFCSSKET